MLALLVGLVVIGIVSAKITPNYTTVQARRIESSLKTEIGDIRSAMDLERVMLGNTPLAAEFQGVASHPTDIGRIEAYLNGLARHQLLRKYPIENSIVFDPRWGTDPGRLYYWEPRLNVLQPTPASQGITSFEAGWATEPRYSSFSPVGWANLLDNTNVVATLSEDTPSAESSVYDDYPGQNKMGQLFRGKGHSLRLERVSGS
jgi:type II secretory pathway pseudopilin PulG